MGVGVEEISKSSDKKLLDSLIREVIRGTSYYYKGYKDVIAGTKQIEEIMGSSSIQAVLVVILTYFIKSKLDKTKYLLAGNEAGLHLEHNSNLATDLGIFLKENLKLSNKYFQVAPEVAIEVDVRIDAKKDSDYIFDKSALLIEHGTKMIVWIMTRDKKAMVIRKGRDTITYDWNEDIELMENTSSPSFTLNIQGLLEEEDIKF